MSLLQLEGVCSGYGAMEVLHGVDLEVDAGEIVGIVGPNGAGKSTLLKTIFRLVSLRSGSIRFGGDELRGVPTHKLAGRGMSYVPQEGNTFVDLSVEDNLKMATRTRHGAGDALEAMLVRFPALDERRRQQAGTLSGGERQMLALASALITEPRFLALDEPTTGLAPTIVQERIGDIRSIRDGGATVLWVIEEEPLECIRHCDRLFVLQGGLLHGPVELEGADHAKVLEDLFFGRADGPEVDA